MTIGFEPEGSRERLLLIDVLRVIGICLVLYQHVSQFYPSLSAYALSVNLWNMLQFDWGKLGVLLFLFASGMSLALKYLNIDSWSEVKKFYAKRLMNIFPAYYVAIVFTIIAEPSILQRTFNALDFAKTAIGMQALGAQTIYDVYGKINGPFWFLTPLLLLYLVFPVLAYSLRIRPNLSIISILAINILSLYLFSQLGWFFAANWWFPSSVMFEFSLGIYLVKKNFYPKLRSRNIIIIYLSSISFFAFLISEPLSFNLGKYPAMFIVGVLASASLLYAFDVFFKNIVSRYRDTVKVQIRFVDS